MYICTDFYWEIILKYFLNFFFSGAGRSASIRRHPKPHPKKLQEYGDQCKERGYNIDVRTAGSLHSSLLKFAKPGIDPIAGYALTTLATVPMKPAVYFAAGTESRESWRHFALNIPYYTHFTSRKPFFFFPQYNLVDLLTTLFSCFSTCADNPVEKMYCFILQHTSFFFLLFFCSNSSLCWRHGPSSFNSRFGERDG